MKRFIAYLICSLTILSAYSAFPVLGATIPTVTGVKKIDSSSNTVYVQWNNVKNAVGYRIEYKAPNQNKFTKKDVGPITNTALSGLSANTSYSVQIKAKVGKNYGKSWSKAVKMSTSKSTSIAQVKNVTPTRIQPTTVTICWNSVYKATGYKVAYQCLNKTIDSDIHYVNTNKTQFTISGLKKDTTYNFQVIARKNTIVGTKWSQSRVLATTTPISNQVWIHFRNKGYSKEATAAILGNMMRECGGDTLNLIYNCYNGTDYGLLQLDTNSIPNIKNMNATQQLNYFTNTVFEQEFKKFGDLYKKGFTLNDFKKMSDVTNATKAFCKIVIRVHDFTTRRTLNAKTAYKRFKFNTPHD